MATDPKIYDEGFSPRRAGRTPMVDVSELMVQAAKFQGLWISKQYTVKEALSVAGQLRRKGYEVVTNIVDEDHREVYVRYVSGTANEVGTDGDD